MFKKSKWNHLMQNFVMCHMKVRDIGGWGSAHRHFLRQGCLISKLCLQYPIDKCKGSKDGKCVYQYVKGHHKVRSESEF